MNAELASHISALAAPIYAAFLARAIATRCDNVIPADILDTLRSEAIIQAQALWQQTLLKPP